MTEPWYSPVTNILGYSLLYYYYLFYYLIFSFYDTPDPDDQSPFKSMKFKMWCNVILLKLWRGEASDFWAGNSTLGHCIMLYLISTEQRNQMTLIWILSNLFHFLFFVLLLVYPLVLFVSIYVPALILENDGQGKSASFRACVQDPMWTMQNIWENSVVETIHDSVIVKYDYAFCWLHRAAYGVFVMAYCPELNGFKESYQIASKKVTSERCYQHNVPHPPALNIWDDYDWSTNEDGFAIKPAWGAWHGQALWNGSELYFVNTLEEAQKVLETTELGRNEVIAQKKMFADEEFYQLWGGEKRLEAFRAYSSFVGGEYNVLPAFHLIYSDEHDVSCLLIVRTDKKEIGLLYEEPDDEEYRISDKHQGKQFKWLDRLDEMKAVLIDAHQKMLPGICLSAWDIAITTEGVKIIECGITGDLGREDFDDPVQGKLMFAGVMEEFRTLRDFWKSYKK